MIIQNPLPDRVDEFRIELKTDDNTSANDRSSVYLDGKRFGEFQVPFTRQEVEWALDDMSSPRVASDPLTAFGSTLFNALFTGDLGRELWTKLDEVERNNRGLRLRIESNLERLQHLPWELLFDPSRRDFLSLSGRVTLVRTRPENSGLSLDPLERLRVLVVVADWADNPERMQDLHLLRTVTENSAHTVDELEIKCAQDLWDRLDRDTYDVFHFAGTGAVLPQTSKRGGLRQSLQLTSRDGSITLIDRQYLGEMLRKAKVRLAVLNACHTDWVARSLAKYIPSAIGFRETVRHDSCHAICESFYTAILAGTSLDLAVTASRQAMDRATPGTGDWCKLIFYLQQKDGEFLRPPTVARSSRQAGLELAEKRGNKEAVKLARLIDVYEANLAEAGQRPGSSDLTVDLLQRISDLKARLAAELEVTDSN